MTRRSLAGHGAASGPAELPDHLGEIERWVMPNRLSRRDSADMNLTSQMIRSRAQSVRKLAYSLPSLAAVAVRRRAAELELQAWVFELRVGDSMLREASVA